jgi:hypothetical protein
MKINFLIILVCFLVPRAFSQDLRLVDDPVAENKLTAHTKQLGQFIRRFNGEEDKTGKRLYEGEKFYRDKVLRENYLSTLFDNNNITITNDSKKKFINYITEKNLSFLDLHDDKWFAELSTTFKYKGKEETVTLYLKFEQKDLGWQWVISGVYSKSLVSFADRKNLKAIDTLHPMSHEIDFMNLAKVFQKPESIVSYTRKDYQVDLLTVFITLVKQKQFEYVSTEALKYNFFQIDNYYFQVSEFTRDELNAGWLISNLISIPEGEKEQFIKLIRHENY